MPEAEHSTTARLPVPVIWGYVREMDNWAPFLRGYQSHEKQSDTDSIWVLKGDVGMIDAHREVPRPHRRVGRAVARCSFTLKGLNEPMQGGGELPARAVRGAGRAEPRRRRRGSAAVRAA